MQLRGTYQPRTWAFPQLPWGTLMRPRVVAAEGPGKALLCSGWYGVARKIHYTCDIAFALVWGASCGFDDVLPFFYAIFFKWDLIYFRNRSWWIIYFFIC